ncbi:MAG: aminotransferase class III-fold pyridoxal phosphate-dependent enzyme [Phycisphaeraceae bacterium]|nr:aminotransferase class III-fold pyridoxal phosphate-dependent enzyme [Phycisphaeraceae bacterium]
MTTTQEIIASHEQHMIVNLPRYPIAVVRGQGSLLLDAEGKEYVDLFAGFGAPILGHCHPDLVAAVTEQAKKLWHVGNLLHTEPQTLAAQAITRHGFGGRVFFCHSGADANEAAIKLTRLYGKAHPGKTDPAQGGRYKVISATRSFHGRSFATMGATGQPAVREGFAPLLPGYVNVEYNSLPAIQAELDDLAVAVIVEPIQGEGGVILPDDSYLPALRKLCDQHDLLLIFDEVWTGCGRTGRYFGHQHWPVTPDIMTLGKGVGGGLPVGAMVAGPRAAEYFDYRTANLVKHATTLGNNCLSMAVTAAIFQVIERDNLLQKARDLGTHALGRLQALAAQNPAVKSVRGKGLFLGIELNPDAPNAPFKAAGDVVQKCLDRGLLINAAQKVVLRLAPALTITQKELDRGLDILEAVLRG